MPFPLFLVFLHLLQQRFSIISAPGSVYPDLWNFWINILWDPKRFVLRLAKDNTPWCNYYTSWKALEGEVDVAREEFMLTKGVIETASYSCTFIFPNWLTLIVLQWSPFVILRNCYWNKSQSWLSCVTPLRRRVCCGKRTAVLWSSWHK